MCDIKDDGLTSICTKKIAMIKFIEMFIIAILGASPKVCFRKKNHSTSCKRLSSKVSNGLKRS